MSVSHNAAEETTHAGAMDRLLAHIEARRGATDLIEDWEAYEEELHRLFMEAECETMAEELARLDVDLPFVVIDDKVHYRVLRHSECTYEGVAGDIRVERTLYRASGAEHALVPMELRAGIVEGHWTPLAAKHMTWVAAHLTPGEGEELFQRLGGMSPSKSSLDRVPKGLSAHWEAQREAFEAALREGEEIPAEAVSVAASLDGVMVALRKGEYPGKEEQGAGYREAACATLSFFDEDGERLETHRMARMPEPGKVTLKTMLAEAIQSVLERRPDLQLVKLADGAKDNWRYLSKDLPPGVELVDYFHAAEHLKSAITSAYGEDTPMAEADFEKYRLILKEDSGGVEKVIRHLRYLADKYPRRKTIRTALKYFRNNRKRMAYAEALEENLPIGSGVVEAACKTLVTQRLKRSGMRWGIAGGQAVLTFRALAQSDRFDHGWQLVAPTYKKDISLPENVVSISVRNRA